MKIILAAVLFVGTQCWGSAPFATTGNPGYYRFKLGKIEVTALSDGTAELPMDKLLTKAPEKEIKSAFTRNFLGEKFGTSINAFLLNTGAKLILVDTGAGNVMGPGGGHLLEHLKLAGYKPEQVDMILITHLHGDHIGSLSTVGKAVFPNATVSVGKADLDFWLDAKANSAKVMEGLRGMFEVAQAAVAPYAQAKKLIPLAGKEEITPEIHAISAAGHTPGHMTYMVESEGQKLYLIGDLVHVASVQFEHPGVCIQFDFDQKAAEKERESAFTEAAKKGYLIGAAHLPFPGVGHIRADKKAFAYVPVNYTP